MLVAAAKHYDGAILPWDDSGFDLEPFGGLFHRHEDLKGRLGVNRVLECSDRVSRVECYCVFYMQRFDSFTVGSNNRRITSEF